MIRPPGNIGASKYALALGYAQSGETIEAAAALASLGILVDAAAITAVGLLALIWGLIANETESEEMACTSVHSTKVQGPGTCCLAVQSGALTPPPAGTTLPQYTPGTAASYPAGRIATVTDSAGHCASCLIVGSSSRKHPGRPVLKFIRGGPACPTSSQGCCILNPAAGQLATI